MKLLFVKCHIDLLRKNTFNFLRLKVGKWKTLIARDLRKGSVFSSSETSAKTQRKGAVGEEKSGKRGHCYLEMLLVRGYYLTHL